MTLGVEVNKDDWYKQTHKKVFVATKKEMMEKIADYRADDWTLLTFGNIFSEMEKGDQIVTIIRDKNRKEL